MNIYIKDSSQDPNVEYAGKILPRDARAYAPLPENENVSYAGNVLPNYKPAITPDRLSTSTNNPSLIILGSIVLPPDTMITINTKKILVADNILDGVSVIERINRAPYEIEFDCILRMGNVANKGNFRNFTKDTTGLVTNVFPQEYLYDIWTSTWLPDTVLEVQNTVLNNIFITQVVIESCNPTTVRGSTNIPLRIKCYENVQGKSLIISTTNSISQ